MNINNNNAIENKIKWALPLILIGGYIFTFSHFQWNAFEYAVCSISALAACLLLIKNINFREENYTAAWMAILLFFVIYFVRFYWLTIDATPVKVMLPSNPYMTMEKDREGLAQAFRLTVASFVGLIFPLIAAPRLIKGKQNHEVNQPEAWHKNQYGKLPAILICISIPAMLVLAYITYRYRIGEMGAVPSEALPYRLKGVVFYSRTVVFPLTMLLVVYLAERNENYFISRVGMLLLILHGLVDMLLRNSRSSLLLVILLLIFLTIAGGYRLRLREKILAGGLMVLALFIVPFMTQYRRMRVQFELSHFDALWAAVGTVGNEWYLQAFLGLKFALFRLPGIESIWCMVSWGGLPTESGALDLILSKDGVAGYLTHVIYPLLETDNTLLAPGFVGWFYLVGGYSAVFLGGIATGVTLISVWKYLGSKYLQTHAVARAFFLWMVFLVLTEGTLDSMARMVLIGAVSIGGMEILSRWWLRDQYPSAIPE
jgi:hypothetical protein